MWCCKQNIFKKLNIKLKRNSGKNYQKLNSINLILTAELLIGFPLLYSGAHKGAMQLLDIMGSKPLNSHIASRSCIWSICISLHITDTHIVLFLCFFIYKVPRCWYCCPYMYKQANFKHKFNFIILYQSQYYWQNWHFLDLKLQDPEKPLRWVNMHFCFFFYFLFFLYFNFLLKNDWDNALWEDISRIF